MHSKSCCDGTRTSCAETKSHNPALCPHHPAHLQSPCACRTPCCVAVGATPSQKTCAMGGTAPRLTAMRCPWACCAVTGAGQAPRHPYPRRPRPRLRFPTQQRVPETGVEGAGFIFLFTAGIQDLCLTLGIIIRRVSGSRVQGLGLRGVHVSGCWVSELLGVRVGVWYELALPRARKGFLGAYTISYRDEKPDLRSF